MGVRRSGEVRIGISGWRYKPWRGAFYPEKLPQKSELAFASSKLNSIEINGTFYSLQRPSSFARWSAETPENFIFSVKGPRFITHIRRLREVEGPLANFMASGVLLLGKKLGPFLWQLPPNFKYQPAPLEAFFQHLPMDSMAALKLGQRHDLRIKSEEGLEVTERFPLRHAIEIRHQSFVEPEFVALLRKYKVALVCADTPEWPRLMDLTSDFVYCRLHGSEKLYSSGYDDKSLDAWASRVTDWARGSEPQDAERVVAADKRAKRTTRDVFLYFDNDMKVKAPVDAAALAVRVKQILPQAL